MVALEAEEGGEFPDVEQGSVEQNEGGDNESAAEEENPTGNLLGEVHGQVVAIPPNDAGDTGSAADRAPVVGMATVEAGAVDEETGAQDGGAESPRPGAQGVVLPFHAQGRKSELKSGGATVRPGAHTPRGVGAGKPPKSKKIKVETDSSRPPVPAGNSEVWYAVEKDGAGWKIRKRWYEMDGGVEVCRTLYLFRIGGGAWARMKARYNHEQIKIIIADKIKRTERTAARRSA